MGYILHKQKTIKQISEYGAGQFVQKYPKDIDIVEIILWRVYSW
jgi:hypothetical protein